MISGRRNWEFAHRLVAEAFFGPCPEGYYVLHGDNNPKNNKVENLRYGTPQENCADKLIHGTQPTGEKIAWHKLKENQIVDIRCRRASGEKLADIAADYGISEVYVWSICTGQKWPNAGGPIEGKVRNVNILNGEQREEVLRLRSEGWGIHRLAVKFNTSNTQIHNLVKKNDIKPAATASSPSSGPTIVFSTITHFAGSLPVFRSFTISSASLFVKLPEIED